MPTVGYHAEASALAPPCDVLVASAKVKQTVSIELAGQKFRLTTDADPEHLLRLAGQVNERLNELGPKVLRSASPAQLLAVVALGLAEDLERSDERYANLERVTRKAVGSALERIERSLGGAASPRE